jgi:rhamnosyltransferase
LTWFSMNEPPVCILLATYNGAQFIDEQVESIRAQTFANWKLLVCDDGSIDGTQAKLSHLASQDARIEILPLSGTPSGGAKNNFNRLLVASLDTASNLFFLCDQDDVWRTDKLERQKKYFPQCGCEDKPLLVHSDLEVVDQNMQSIADSMVTYMSLNVNTTLPLNYLLSRNFVTGCGTAINRQLLISALPIPKDAIMHDWWLALVASCEGSLKFIDEPLVRYRQHGANTIGARGLWYLPASWREISKAWRRGTDEFHETFQQAQALRQICEQQKKTPQADYIEKINDYAQLLDAGMVARLRTAALLNVRPGEPWLKLPFWLRLLTAGVNRKKKT